MRRDAPTCWRRFARWIRSCSPPPTPPLYPARPWPPRTCIVCAEGMFFEPGVAKLQGPGEKARRKAGQVCVCLGRGHMGMNERRSADQVWAIELHGIEPVSDQDRHGRPFELFWVWFAANIGILGIVYGAILSAAGLNLLQSALVALAGSAGSFLLVGVLSAAGKWGGAPSLTLSRAPFGIRGNLGPALLSWISLVGWETISVITATYALLGLLAIFGLPPDTLVTIVSLIARLAAGGGGGIAGSCHAGLDTACGHLDLRSA